MCKSLLVVVTVVTFGFVTSMGLAQRGVGDATGVVRQAVQPETVELSGQVIEVKTEPCEQTTGPSLVGAHFFLKNSEGQTLNIHLGPASQVEFAIRELVPDRTVKVHGFRTEKMKEGHYVAQQITWDDHVLTLRDETLRPVWAAGAAGGGPRAGSGEVRGSGSGYGPSAGRGLGRGQGRGGRYGRYRNGGRGAAAGQGYGRQGR